jgi:hypothetical protein
VSLIAAALLAQVVVQVPVMKAPRDAGNPLSVPAEAERLTLVIAETVTQIDPIALCPDGNCTSLFQGTFKQAVVVAGLPLAETFTARIEMGSPFDQSYRAVFVVEQRDGKEALVRAMRGFHYQTQLACFDAGELRGIDWKPEGPNISYRGNVLCVKE